MHGPCIGPCNKIGDRTTHSANLDMAGLGAHPPAGTLAAGQTPAALRDLPGDDGDSFPELANRPFNQEIKPWRTGAGETCLVLEMLKSKQGSARVLLWPLGSGAAVLGDA